MKRKPWLACAALFAALSAQAQQTGRTPDPLDPSAAVPAIVYRPVSTAPAAPAGSEQTPDKAWRAANDALAAQASHAGHHAPEPAPAPSQQPPREQAPATPSQDQHQHHRAGGER